jgi:DNA-binding transcriptional MerR regulator
MPIDPYDNPPEPLPLHFSTGEFARLCHVKKQTLFHYDDIGLLVPDKVESNGYRSYSYQQYETFMMIAGLKEAGMSLTQIRVFLDEKDTGKRRTAIANELDRLDERIAHLERVRAVLSTEVVRFDNAVEIISDAVTIVDLPALRMLRSSSLYELDDAALVRAVADYVTYSNIFSTALLTSDIARGDCTRYVFLLAHTSEKPRRTSEIQRIGNGALVPFTRPAGRYAVTYHRGPYDTAGDAHRRVLAFLDTMELGYGTYAYEEYLRNEITTCDPNDYLMRVIIPLS